MYHLVVVSVIRVAFLWRGKLAKHQVLLSVCITAVLFHLCSFVSACQKVKKKPQNKTQKHNQKTKPVAEIAGVLVFSNRKMSAYSKCFSLSSGLFLLFLTSCHVFVLGNVIFQECLSFISAFIVKLSWGCL